MLMVIPEFNVAFTKATQIRHELYKKSSEDRFIPLDEIVEAVKQVSDVVDIFVATRSFSELPLPEEIRKSCVSTYGAMLSTTTRMNSNGTKERIAHLIINSDYGVDMQRFSVAHELGHLITDIPNFAYEVADDNRFTISTHVNPDITYISEEECKNNNYLIAEQVANIFALLVLIPRDLRIRDLKNEGVEKLTKKYGVTPHAIYSRMLLSNVKFPQVKG